MELGVGRNLAPEILLIVYWIPLDFYVPSPSYTENKLTFRNENYKTPRKGIFVLIFQCR